MKKDVIHGAVASKSLVRLKTIVDKNDEEELTMDVIREFEEVMDSVMQQHIQNMDLKEEIINTNVNRSLFTQETVRAVKAVKEFEKSKKENESYR